MILFLLAAVPILIYSGAYVLFCVKKGGIAAALSVLGLMLLNVGLLFLLVHFRINT